MTSLRPLLALTAAGLLATACGPAHKPPADQAQPQQAAAKAEPAATATPLTFKQETADADVALQIDPAIAAWPALHAAIYAEDVGYLKGFAADAVKNRGEAVGMGAPDLPYQSETDWKLSAKAAPLVSLRRMAYDFTGGAHPNHGSTGRLWNAATGKEVAVKDLFAAGADMTALDTAICDAVKAAQTKRGVDQVDGTIFACPKWSETTLVLAQSKTPDKAGGLIALIDPYVVGSYAEGDYEVVIPLAKFASLLAPTYAAAFAGEPASLGRPDGTVTQEFKSQVMNQ